MANNFAGDANCKAWWQFEPGARLVDTKTLNDFVTELNDVSTDELHLREGRASIAFHGEPPATVWVDDGDLATGFPLKDGDLTKQISICFWLRFTTVTTGAGTWKPSIIQKGYAYVASLIFAGHKEVAGTPKFRFTTGHTDGEWLNWEAHDIEVPAVAGRWYHVGITYKDADKSWRVRIWDSTAETVTDTTDMGTNAIALNTFPLMLGWPSRVCDTFDGWLDELVVFDDILTADEIDDIRNGVYVMESTWNGPEVTPTLPGEPSPEVITLAPFYGIATFPIKEKLSWNTEILQPHTRLPEQRIAKRWGIPRQTVTIPFILPDAAAVAEFENLMHAYGKGAWPVPLWWEAQWHAGAIPAAETAIAVDTAYCQYFAGSYVMLFYRRQGHWETTADACKVAAVAAASLTLETGPGNTYPDGAWVLPCRYGYLLEVAELEKYPGGAAKLDVTFAVKDNDTVLASSAGTFYGWSGDLAGTDNPDTIAMTEDKDVQAHFLAPP